MKKGRYGAMTHEYKRNGTTTLFAALSLLDGTVIGDCIPRHRHQEFIPTSSSWFNTVEHWFRDLTERRIRRGIFRNFPELLQAIEEYLHHHNGAPKPFVWKKSAQAILAKVYRARVVLDKIRTG